MRAEDFSCSLDVLYGGVGISKLQFLNKKYQFFSLNFWSSKPWSWIRMGIEPKMLDPDPDSMNLDPKHCKKQSGVRLPSVKAGNLINDRY